MKLLFDQNISYKIVKTLSGSFSDCVHVSTVGLTNASDEQVWSFAKKNDFSIVTFDADFVNIATLKGHPPKIIYLRTGNRKTADIADLLIARKDQLSAFLHDNLYENIACFEISN